MTILQFITAFMPIISILIFLVFLKIPSKFSMPIGFILTSLFSFFVWKMPLNAIYASVIEGCILALSILWIMFGVIFTYHILQVKGINNIIKESIENITTDKRIQLILITIYFTSLIEGIAGFGTSAMLCIPILIALGFKPFTSVVFSVLGNIASINFGATGTPVLIGITSGLKNGEHLYPQVENYLVNKNMDLNSFLHQITNFSEGINLFTTALLPLIMVVLYSKFFSEKKSFKYGFSFWKFALVTGFIYTSIVYLCQRFLGYEFPSIISGILTTILTVYFAHKNYFLNNKKNKSKKYNLSNKDILFAFLPYLSLTVLLIITRLHPRIKVFLKSFKISLQNINQTPISVNFEYAYSTGSIFFVIGIFSLLIMKIKTKDTKKIIKNTFVHMINPCIVLLFSIAMIRIFLNSYINSLNLPSQPTQIAMIISNIFGKLYPMVEVFIGILGAFLTGSCTFSTMMFSLIQFDTAIQINQNPAHSLALQLTGGSIGNAISILNIAAACGLSSIINKEGEVIKYNIIPVLIYCLLIGIIAYIIYIL